MFLKSLKINNDTELIREIVFHKGINLIVDETKTEKKTESGNSVGKTTVLRLIDFCLDGNGQNIYIDPEFKTVNYKIESFLRTNNVIITLTLVDNLDDIQSQSVVIRKNFVFKDDKKSKVLEINGDALSATDFTIRLKELLFKSKAAKPKIRQLISKNIRDEKNKLVHTLKVLSPFNTDADYEALFLFWFGISVDSRKNKLLKDKTLEEKLQVRLKKEGTLSQINQSLRVINKEISELEAKKNSFNLNEDYEADLRKLNEAKQLINSLSSTMSRLELRKDLILESKDDLEKDFANIDTSQIKKMYEKASALIPNMQKTFEETVAFHNEMVKQKIDFITEELPQLELEINNNKRNLIVALNTEKSLSAMLQKTGAIEDLQKIVAELNKYHEQKGKFEELKRLWDNSNSGLEQINKDLEEINKNISSKDKVIQEKIAQFNEFFSDISNRLDGLHSVLSADNTEGIYKFSIANIEGNPGTGSKKSQMASFDLAYIKFADATGIPCLHFVLQDQIENVHSNQITNLLTEIVEEVNCQYVLPVLRDKLPKGLDLSQYEVLSLSQDKKLFKVV